MTTDALSQALEHAGVRGEVYCRTLLPAEAELRFPPDQAHFHVVRRGSVRITAGDAHDPVLATSGDLLLLIGGQGHGISCSSRPAVAVPLDEAIAEHFDAAGQLLDLSGGEPHAELICGRFDMDPIGRAALVGALPEMLHVQADDSNSAELPTLVALLAREASSSQAGTRLALSRLVDLVLVHAIRQWIGRRPDAPASWLSALRDPAIGTTLRAMHADPARPWTVASLADVAGLSRSRFADRFTSLVGTAPMRYLTDVRMATATRLLAAGRPVGKVATAVGYSSDSSFSRTYKRETGRPPTSVRLAADIDAP